MELKFKRIEDKHEKYDAHSRALTWDNKHTYSQEKSSGADWMFDKMVGVYDADELVALGCITPYFDDEYKRSLAYLSSIVRKDHRRMGISDILLRNMLEYCKDLNIKKVTVEILKSNKISINSIEKNNFNLKENNDKVLVYEKKLNNKQ